MNQPSNEIGRRIAAARARMEPPMTIQDLADRLGVSRASMSRYESSERAFPVELIGPVAEVLGVPADWIRAGDEGAPPPFDPAMTSLSMEALHSVLESSGFTYAWLGREIGAGPQTVEAWLKGTRKPQDPFAANKILSALLRGLQGDVQRPIDVPEILKSLAGTGALPSSVMQDEQSVPLVRTYHDWRSLESGGETGWPEVPTSPGQTDAVFAFQVSGDDNAPSLQPADYVFIRPADSVQSGSYYLWGDPLSATLILRMARAGDAGIMLVGGDNAPSMPSDRFELIGQACGLRRTFGDGRWMEIFDRLGLTRAALGQ